MNKAIILAAGRGSRMKPFTNKLPKCRTNFFGKELIEWQLEAIRANGFSSENTALIRGYLKETFDFDLTYFENPIWDKSNMVKTLSFAQDWAKDSNTLISYADIIYSGSDIKNLIENSKKDINILYDPNWRDLWELRFDDPLSDAETFIHDGSISYWTLAIEVTHMKNTRSIYGATLFLSEGLGDIFRLYLK